MAPFVRRMCDAGIQVALFVEPEPTVLDLCKSLGAPAIELHTGAYCEAMLADRAGEAARRELARLRRAAEHAAAIDVECHAGHGLTYESVGPVAAIPAVVELNIGHFLVGEAIFGGLDAAIRRMRAAMDLARAEAGGVRSA